LQDETLEYADKDYFSLKRFVLLADSVALKSGTDDQWNDKLRSVMLL